MGKTDRFLLKFRKVAAEAARLRRSARRAALRAYEIGAAARSAETSAPARHALREPGRVRAGAPRACSRPRLRPARGAAGDFAWSAASPAAPALRPARGSGWQAALAPVLEPGSTAGRARVALVAFVAAGGGGHGAFGCSFFGCDRAARTGSISTAKFSRRSSPGCRAPTPTTWRMICSPRSIADIEHDAVFAVLAGLLVRDGALDIEGTVGSPRAATSLALKRRWWRQPGQTAAVSNTTALQCGQTRVAPGVPARAVLIRRAAFP